MKLLHWIFGDWARAPISGTVQILALVGCIVCFYHDNIDRGLLFLILSHVIAVQRGPFNAEEI